MTGRASRRRLAVVAALPLAAGRRLRRRRRGEPGDRAGDDRRPPRPPITVFAAASLTESFTQIGKDFEADSGSKVTFNFAGSSALATQINQGAPADVFAAASPATMKTVTDAGNAGAPVDFVTNTLQIAVPKGNPGKITGLADLADADKRSRSVRRRCRAARRRRRCSRPPRSRPRRSPWSRTSRRRCPR